MITTTEQLENNILEYCRMNITYIDFIMVSFYAYEQLQKEHYQLGKREIEYDEENEMKFKGYKIRIDKKLENKEIKFITK